MESVKLKLKRRSNTLQSGRESQVEILGALSLREKFHGYYGK